MHRLINVIKEYNPDLDILPNGFNHYSGNEDIGHILADEMPNNQDMLIDTNPEVVSIISKYSPKKIYKNSNCKMLVGKALGKLKEKGLISINYKNKNLEERMHIYFNFLRSINYQFS
jgi:hypothetical protein